MLFRSVSQSRYGVASTLTTGVMVVKFFLTIIFSNLFFCFLTIANASAWKPIWQDKNSYLSEKSSTGGKKILLFRNYGNLANTNDFNLFLSKNSKKKLSRTEKDFMLKFQNFNLI